MDFCIFALTRFRLYSIPPPAFRPLFRYGPVASETACVTILGRNNHLISHYNASSLICIVGSFDYTYNGGAEASDLLVMGGNYYTLSTIKTLIDINFLGYYFI